MIELRGFLVWACFVAGISRHRERPSRPAQAMLLFFADGYSHEAVAREMGISAHQVAQYVRESVEKLSVQEWTTEELALFEQMGQRIRREESAREHFAALLDAIRNSQDPTPRTVEYDANGRAIGGRSPLVDVDTAMAACVGIQSFPSKVAKNLKLSPISPPQ